MWAKLFIMVFEVHKKVPYTYSEAYVSGVRVVGARIECYLTWATNMIENELPRLLND